MSFAGSAQSKEKIELKILEEKSGKPVPYAHAVLLNTGNGSVSNEDGVLELSVVRNPDQLIRISAIGFETKTIPLSEVRHKEIIYLKEAIITLAGVQITPVDRAKELIVKSIENITKNYPDDYHFLDGFYRETAYADPGYLAPYYQIEAALKVLKTPYSETDETGQVQLIKGRIGKAALNDSLFIKFYSGPHLPHRFDYVKFRYTPFTLKSVGKQEFEILDTLIYDSKQVFVVGFRRANSTESYDKLYIQDSSYAVCKIEVFPKKNKRGLELELLSDHERINNNITVTYAEYDGLWRLNRILYKTGFREKKTNRQAHFVSEFITTRFYRTDQTTIPYGKRIFYRDIPYDQISKLDTGYWSENTTLKIDHKSVNLFDSTYTYKERTSPLDRKIELIKKFGASMNLGYRSLNYPGRSVLFKSDEVDFTGDFTGGSDYKLTLGSSVDYTFSNNWYASIDLLNSLSSNDLGSVHFGAHRQFLMNKKGRAVYFDLGASLHYYWYNAQIGSMKGRPFKIDDVLFDSKMVNVYNSIKEFGLSPHLKLRLELTPQYQLCLLFNHYQTFYRDTGILFKENSGFMRKSKFISSTTMTGGKIDYKLLNNYLIAVGVRFSLK